MSLEYNIAQLLSGCSIVYTDSSFLNLEITITYFLQPRQRVNLIVMKWTCFSLVLDTQDQTGPNQIL